MSYLWKINSSSSHFIRHQETNKYPIGILICYPTWTSKFPELLMFCQKNRKCHNKQLLDLEFKWSWVSGTGKSWVSINSRLTYSVFTEHIYRVYTVHQERNQVTQQKIVNSLIWKCTYPATEIVKQNAEHEKHSHQGLHWRGITLPSLPFPAMVFILISRVELNLAPNQVKRQASESSALLTRKTKF